MISGGRSELGVPQILSAVDTFQAPLVDCRKNTAGPGFTRAAAHIDGDAIAHTYLSMLDPAGSAARMEAFVHSPEAPVADEAPVVGVFAGTDLCGVTWVGVADVVASPDDEHPVRNANPVPPKAMRSDARLAVV